MSDIVLNARNATRRSIRVANLPDNQLQVLIGDLQQALAIAQAAVPGTTGGGLPPPPVQPPATDPMTQCLQLVNASRAQAGLKPLQASPSLRQAAQQYAQVLAQPGVTISHTGPDGSTFVSRIHATGYSGNTIGENIAQGFATATEVMNAWLASPTHAANILQLAYQDIGIGLASSASLGNIWVQDFGGGATPVQT
jgi:uncharacterized protein YkwD